MSIRSTMQVRDVVLAAGVLTAALAGCSPNATETRIPVSGGPDLGAPYVPWDRKSHDEKKAFMGAHVEPTMRKLFQAYSPKGYADFGCQTCHGADMDSLDFRMPNSIYPLAEKDTIADATSYDEDTTNFMMKKVVPTFAGLLGQHPVEPGATGGVSCFTCHPHE